MGIIYDDVGKDRGTPSSVELRTRSAVISLNTGKEVFYCEEGCADTIELDYEDIAETIELLKFALKHRRG